jgi:hypothetical protein
LFDLKKIDLYNIMIFLYYIIYFQLNNFAVIYFLFIQRTPQEGDTLSSQKNKIVFQFTKMVNLTNSKFNLQYLLKRIIKKSNLHNIYKKYFGMRFTGFSRSRFNSD